MRVAPVPAIGTFRERINFYEAAHAAGAPVGSTSMTAALVVYWLRRIPAGGTERAITRSTNLNFSGFELITSGGTWIFDINDGGGSLQRAQITGSAPARSIQVVTGAYDGSEVRIRSQGGTDATAAAGYTSNTSALGIGSRAGGVPDEPVVNYVIAAYLHSDSQALTDAQMATLEAELEDNLRHGRDLDFNLSAFVPEFYWDASDVVIGPGVADTPWTDRIAGVDAVRTGLPEGYGVPARI